VFLEPYDSFPAARKREMQIKKWKRDKKEVLISKFSLGLPTKMKVYKNKELI
jgi:predicted GIY-YIG superfamily endonuclease